MDKQLPSENILKVCEKEYFVNLFIYLKRNSLLSLLYYVELILVSKIVQPILAIPSDKLTFVSNNSRIQDILNIRLIRLAFKVLFKTGWGGGGDF